MTECQNYRVASEYMFFLQNSRMTLEMFHIQKPVLFSRDLFSTSDKSSSQKKKSK